jgi:hypothetical protein
MPVRISAGSVASQIASGNSFTATLAAASPARPVDPDIDAHGPTGWIVQFQRRGSHGSADPHWYQLQRYKGALDEARPVRQAFHADAVFAGVGLGRKAAAAPVRYAILPGRCGDSLSGHGIVYHEKSRFARINS